MMRALAALLALAACKADIHTTTDANAPHDGPGDALGTNTGDPSSSAVKLTITRAGDPVPGVAVVFQNADSSLVGAVLTNSTGLAWAEMVSGGYVTAIEHKSSGLDELTTFAAVAQGDALALAFAPTGPLAQTTIALTIPDGGAASYKIHTPCGATTITATTAAVPLVGCDSVVDFVVLPLDGDGNPAGTSLYASTVAVDPPSVTLIGQYQPLAPTTFTYGNVPASWQFISTYHAVSAQRRAFEASTGTTPSNGAAATSLLVPPTSATTLTVSTQFPTTGEIGQQSTYSWSAAATSYALDLATAQLPAFATAPAFDPVTRTVTWTERTAATQPDLVRARLRLYRDDVPSGRAWSWRLVAPRSGTKLAYPQLPALGFDFNPRPNDSRSVDELTAVSVPGGYAAFRARAFGDFPRAVTGASGRMLVQTLTSAEP